MKKDTISLAALALFAVGCRAQLPPQPIYQCPAANGTYAALNSSTPTSATTYADNNSSSNAIAPGGWCYVVQTLQTANGQTGVSNPSNTALAVLVAGNSKVVLNWNAPAADGISAPYQYVVSRIAAVVATPGAPVIGSPAISEIKTQLPPFGETPAAFNVRVSSR